MLSFKAPKLEVSAKVTGYRILLSLIPAIIHSKECDGATFEKWASLSEHEK